jgi:hypothetical protein
MHGKLGKNMNNTRRLVQLFYDRRYRTPNTLSSNKHRDTKQSPDSHSRQSKVHIKGWGVPVLICVATSALLWSLIFFSGSALLKIIESHGSFNFHSPPTDPTEPNTLLLE